MTKEKILDILWEVFNHEILPDVAINELRLASTEKTNELPKELVSDVLEKANEAAKEIYNYRNEWYSGDIEVYLQTVLLDMFLNSTAKPKVSGDLPISWSPVETEKKWQESQLKKMFPNYPNDQPDWQRLNFFIEAGLKYLNLTPQEKEISNIIQILNDMAWEVHNKKDKQSQIEFDVILKIRDRIYCNIEKSESE